MASPRLLRRCLYAALSAALAGAAAVGPARADTAHPATQSAAATVTTRPGR